MRGDRGAAISLQVERYTYRPNASLNYARVFLQTDYGIASESDSNQSDAASSLTAGLSARFAALLGTLELSQALRGRERRGDVGAFLYVQIGL